MEVAYQNGVPMKALCFSPTDLLIAETPKSAEKHSFLMVISLPLELVLNAFFKYMMGFMANVTLSFDNRLHNV
jgi:hypothetical protein